jgi:hypothetical protein
MRISSSTMPMFSSVWPATDRVYEADRA